MRRIHKTLASGLEVEFQVSEELVREYQECSTAADCKNCGWNNARIVRQCACSLPELRELLEDPSEELTGWKAQMMRTLCGRGLL